MTAEAVLPNKLASSLRCGGSLGARGCEGQCQTEYKLDVPRRSHNRHPNPPPPIYDNRLRIRGSKNHLIDGRWNATRKPAWNALEGRLSVDFPKLLLFT